jgi:hypothetical protein
LGNRGTTSSKDPKIFNPSGEPIARIDFPERCANHLFRGKRNRLFMTASRSQAPATALPVPKSLSNAGRYDTDLSGTAQLDQRPALADHVCTCAGFRTPATTI